MLELEQFGRAFPGGGRALYRATLSFPSLLLWLAGALSLLMPAPCALAQAPRERLVAAHFVAPTDEPARVVSPIQKEN
jgi:hypothetical protein